MFFRLLKLVEQVEEEVQEQVEHQEQEPQGQLVRQELVGLPEQLVRQDLARRASVWQPVPQSEIALPRLLMQNLDHRHIAGL
jgi:hypothetical protein